MKHSATLEEKCKAKETDELWGILSEPDYWQKSLRFIGNDRFIAQYRVRHDGAD